MFCFGYHAIPINIPSYFGRMFSSMSQMGFNLGIAAATSGPGLPIFQNNPNQTNFYNQPISFGAFNRYPNGYSTNNNYGFNNNGNINFSGNSNYSFGGFNQPTQSGFSYGGGFNQFMQTPSYLGGFNQPMARKSYFAAPPTTKKYQKITGGVSPSSQAEGITLDRKSNGYGPAFLNKVKDIATKINCNYRDLLALMNSESGVQTHAQNPSGTASGLIQIIDSSAREIGTTAAEIRSMDPMTQLTYVEKYLVRAKQIAGFSPDKPLSAGELYAITFLPGRANQEVLTSSGESYYNQNHTNLDVNSDGKITKTDLAQKIQSSYVSDRSFLA